VVQSESVSTVLGVLGCLYDDRPTDATLLMDMYARDCHSKGADDECVLSSMLSASVYVTMSLLGERGKDRVKDLSMWWAAQCPQ